MKNHYLNILGLNASATEKEIKRAYRKKAMQYHPDKNTSALAEEQFIRINEAYEYLTNPEPYKKQVVEEKSPEEKRKDDFRARMKRAQEIYTKRKEEEQKERLRKFRIFEKTFIYQTSIPVIIFGLCLAFILVLDKNLDSTNLIGYVKDKKVIDQVEYYEFSTTKGEFYASFSDINSYLKSRKEGKVVLHFSPVLNDLTSVSGSYHARNYNSIHFFSELILIFLLFSITGLIFRNPSFESYIAIHISYFIPILTGIYILFKLI